MKAQGNTKVHYMNNTIDQVNYTIINHTARMKLELNLEEYCTADLIHNLSNNPDSPIKGWCYAAKETLCEMLAISRAAMFRYLKRLEQDGLIERNPENTALIRSTSKWYRTVIINKREVPMWKTPSQNETTRLNSLSAPSQNDTQPHAQTPSQNETLQGYINKDINNEEKVFNIKEEIGDNSSPSSVPSPKKDPETIKEELRRKYSKRKGAVPPHAA